MAYDFQKLADVELLEEVPDGASAFVAVNGDVKRVPGSGLGGGGVATAILRLASESDASENAVTPATTTQPVKKLPITCDNYTYAQARAVLEAGNPLAVTLDVGGAWANSILLNYGNSDCIGMAFILDSGNPTPMYWNADGFFDGDPAKYNP